MRIVGLQKVTLIDYPGYIAATVFLAGCNLNCGYCYNRWMIDEVHTPEAMLVDEFLGWLRTRVGRLDGVCVSGGEPTLQEDLPQFLRTIKGLRFAVKLDTNGTQPERLERLLDERLLDYVAMDIKAPLDERYHRVAGHRVDLEAIRGSMALLRRWGMAYEFRTTVGPLIDEAALRDIASKIEGDELWWLQPFISTPDVHPAFSSAPALDAGALREIAKRLAVVAPGVRLRGEEGHS
jgi:pyruvate formate lyase activating enzyme